jgi:type I restriction enzyme S subunit
MYPLNGKGGLDNGYLSWLLLGDGFSQSIVLDSGRVAMPKVNRETLAEYKLPLPHAKEQKAIVEFIATRTSDIDDELTRIERSMEQVRAYRQGLISAVVTGKVDVRQVEVSAIDETIRGSEVELEEATGTGAEENMMTGTTLETE